MTTNFLTIHESSTFSAVHFFHMLAHSEETVEVVIIPKGFYLVVAGKQVI